MGMCDLTLRKDNFILHKDLVKDDSYYATGKSVKFKFMSPLIYMHYTTVTNT